MRPSWLLTNIFDEANVVLNNCKQSKYSKCTTKQWNAKENNIKIANGVMKKESLNYYVIFNLICTIWYWFSENAVYPINLNILLIQYKNLEHNNRLSFTCVMRVHIKIPSSNIFFGFLYAVGNLVRTHIMI